MAEQAQEKLPDDVMDFLDDPDLLFKIIEVLGKYKVDEEKYDDLAVIVEEMVQKPADLGSLPATIGKITGLDMTVATKLSAELAGHWLLPLEAYVGDVAGHIMSWGGKAEDYPPKRIAKRAVQPDEFTKETLHALGANLKDATLQHRLEYILTTYVRGVRAAKETVAVLGRSRKVGGLEMDAVKAKQLVDHITKKMKVVEIDRGEVVPTKQPNKKATKQIKKTKPAATAAPPKLSTPKETGMPLVSEQVPSGKFEATTMTKADEIEAQAAAKQVGPTPKRRVSVKASTAQVVAGITVQLPDEERKKRFAKVVDSRLRGIRDALETRDTLEAAPEQGGVGLGGKDLADAMEQIERQFDEVEEQLQKEKNKEKQKLIGQQKKAAAKRGEMARAEAEMLAKRYASMTGKAPKELLTPTAPTGARVSAARGAEAELQASAKRVDQEKVKQAMARAKRSPDRAAAELSVESVASTGKPKVQDVARAQRLSGPIDELANLNTTSFRRLSSDPKEAIIKIKDKIDLLESESYAKRIAGIKAWQESPINKLYLSLVQEALTGGLSIQDVAKKKLTAGEDSLSEVEAKSVMQLNNQLKF